ncbi:MAG: hypothetical protein OXB98_01665 [Bryobacterales bacterium]|nr:hypothetical protein [Bryobacterales bacterium]
MSAYRHYDLNDVQRVDVTTRLLAGMLANPSVDLAKLVENGGAGLRPLAELAVEATEELELALNADGKRTRELLEKADAASVFRRDSAE